MQQRAAGGECAGAIGPYPFADGSLQIISADLLLALTSPTATHAIARAAHFAGVKPLLKTSPDARIEKGADE